MNIEEKRRIVKCYFPKAEIGFDVLKTQVFISYTNIDNSRNFQNCGESIDKISYEIGKGYEIYNDRDVESLYLTMLRWLSKNEEVNKVDRIQDLITSAKKENNQNKTFWENVINTIKDICNNDF